MDRQTRHLPQACRILYCLSIAFAGCSSGKPAAQAPPSAAVMPSSAPAAPVAALENSKTTSQDPNELNSKLLLENCLPENLLQEGWIRLFDGQSLFGWFAVGKANWRVEDGIIRVDEGEPSFLCTSFQLADYELKVDFRCDPATNSGVFLRTPPSPLDVAKDSLELNIAPPDNPFPTGSFVRRKKLEPKELGELDVSQWHSFRVRLENEKINVWLDEKPIMEMIDAAKLGRGHISLQHNQGRAEFRNVLLRPLAGSKLSLGADWEKDWTKSAKDTFEVDASADGLRLKGGLGQLQSKQRWSDFMLQAVYRLAKPEVNSGVFFRCVPDQMLDGYECQLNHAIADGDPLRPADAGAGAIFRRQPARIVVGDGTTPTYVTLLAERNQFATWVNGLQVTDFTDSRPADENPRKGSRLSEGPISLQGHDATTDVTFKSIVVGALR